MEHTVLSTTGSTRGTAYTMSNKILTHEDKTHVVWLDQIKKIYVCTFDRKENTWGDSVCVGEGDDNHAGAAFAMDSQGYLHLVFDPHHNPIQHVVSAEPNTTDAWNPQPTFGGVNATYPSLVVDSQNTLHVCYRGAFERERPWGTMYQQKPENGDWSDPIKLVDPQGPEAYSHFENALHISSDGTIILAYHIVRAVEHDHDQLAGRGFGLMCSRDSGESWETIQGDPIKLPATPDSPCVLEFDENLDIRIGNPVTDSRGNPYFTLNRRHGEISETFLHRWESKNNSWKIIPLLPDSRKLFGNCCMSSPCALSMSDGDTLYAAAIIAKKDGDWAHPSNEIALFVSSDLGDTFIGSKISSDDSDVPNWLPSLERHTGNNKVSRPNLTYTHGVKGEACNPDIRTEIRYVDRRAITSKQEEIWVRAVSGFEMISGISFTADERVEVAKQAEITRRQFQHLRDFDVAYDIEPPTVFSPGNPSPGPAKPFSWQRESVNTRPDSEEDLAFLPLSDLAHLIESRQISPVELTRLYLERCTTYGSPLNCVVTLMEDLALKQAEAAEAEILKGQYRGPLHGIPWGAKDLLATRGIKTTWGATPFKHRVIDTNATVVDRLNDAGAILVAKLSMGALAMGAHWFGGMTRNPWNIEKGSSGSSAGPGSATSAGLVGFSIGSETTGSILSPSDTCGIVGLRPTYGRVSRYGAMALSWTMDKLGPMCRRVEDCAAVLHFIHGPDGNDPSVADIPFDWNPGIAVDGLRIGYLASEFESVDSPEVRAVDEEALSVFRSLCAVLEPVELPEYRTAVNRIILRVEAATVFDDITRSGEINVMTEQDNSNWAETFRSARVVPAVEYLRAQRIRTTLIREMESLMEDWDVILTSGIGGDSLGLTNLTGHPAINLPCGFVANLPRGITLIGRLYEEVTPLAAALAYEKSTQWHLRRPDLSSVTNT